MKNHITKLFQGRADRKTFLLAIMCVLVITPFLASVSVFSDFIFFPLKLLDFEFFNKILGLLPDLVSIPVGTLLTISIYALVPLAVFLMPAVVRRLHDIGWSVKFCALMFLPIINLLFTLLLLIKPSKKETNQYGEVPIHKKNKFSIFFGSSVCFYSFMSFLQLLVLSILTANPVQPLLLSRRHGTLLQK